MTSTTNQPRAWDFIVVTGIALLVIGLSLHSKSFWTDEMWSLYFCKGTHTGILQSMAFSASPDYTPPTSAAVDCHPPFYFYLLEKWINLFGISEIALRLFQGLLGVGLLLAALCLFRKIFPRQRYHPFWLLFAFSGELWLYLPMLRYYTLAAALAVMAAYFYLTWLENGEWKYAWLLSLAYIAVLYTDYPTAAIILSQGIHLLLFRRQWFWKYCLICLAALTAFLPWFYILLSQISSLTGKSAMIADFNSSPAVILLKTVFSLYAFTFSETLFPFESTLLLALGVIGLTVIFSGLSWQWLKHSTRIYALLVGIVGIFFTAVITTFISKHTSFIFTPPRTLYVLPFVFVFLGMAYASISRPLCRYLFLGSFVVISLAADYNWAVNRHFLNPVYAAPWKQMVAAVKGETGLIVVSDSVCYEYYQQQNLSGQVSPELIAPKQLLEKLNQPAVAPLNVFMIEMEREASLNPFPEELLTRLAASKTKVFTRRYLVYDSDFQKMKAKILKRPSQAAKFWLSKYRIYSNNPAFENNRGK